MSLIVAVRDGDTVAMGADRFIGNDAWKMQSAAPKIIQYSLGNGRAMLVGAAGDVRFSNLLRQMVIAPDDMPEGDWDAESFLTLNFATKLRVHTAAHGYLANEGGRDTAGGELLVALDGRLFVVYDTFDVCEYDEPYTAAGAGASVALGALAALHDGRTAGATMTPGQKVAVVMAATADHSMWVSAAHDIYTVSYGRDVKVNQWTG